MNAQDILAELEPLGSASYKKVLFNHGIQEPCFGVKISELKKIQKRIKKDYRLALELYDTGNYDAMYLAGLIADDAKMTKKDLQRWVRHPQVRSLCGATVPWVASGSPAGWEIALEWVDSKEDPVSAAGWGTLSSIVSVKPDEELEIEALRELLQRVARTIDKAGDLTRYQMNGFVICVGCYVPALTEAAIEVGRKLGHVKADLGNNACEIPFAPDYIQKVRDRGTLGKKRKSAKC